MLRSLFVLAAANCAALLPAQTNTSSVQDVGLTMDGGVLTVIYGQACGPFSCAPFPAGTLSASTANSRSRTVTIHGAPASLFVLAMGQASIVAVPCTPIAGIGNALILPLPAATLAIGVTGAAVPNPSAACRQGTASYLLTVPANAPRNLRFLLQAVTISAATGAPAFTVALAASTQ
jgi:hypothetical protein